MTEVLALLRQLRESCDAVMEHRSWRVLSRRIREDFSSARNKLKRCDADTARDILPASKYYDITADEHYHHGLRHTCPLPAKLKFAVKHSIKSNDKTMLRQAAIFAYNRGFIGLANYLVRKARALERHSQRSSL